MARRYKGHMNGERYLANIDSDHREVHDLDNEKTGSNQCQIDEVIAAGNDRPYNSLEAAKREGFDNCHWCIGDSTR
ncbi:hypothetical protein [Aggregatilinea lenta]|uniref:hypothetical protein n=1 Tax=Aggregatilinea lenta TaxID=913108 RepID=UPI000E5A853A|nr:hypothetical protein [Aggregatilinea lenta]